MPALLERPKMTRAMYEALKRHIMREREKKKQEEQEQDAMMERMRKEREMRKKKEEQDSLTLEETKEQILQLQKKLDMLKAQKQEFFSQLKKVLNQEEETRKRAQLKEQNEMTMSQPAYQHPHLPTAQPMIIHGRPALYKATVPSLGPIMQPGIKRQRTPSPTPPISSSSSSSTSFQSYHSEPKYPHTSEKYSHAESKYSSHSDTKFAHAEPKYLASYATGAKAAGPPGHLYGAQHAQPGDYKNPAYQQSGASHLYPANQSFQPQQAASAGAYSGSQGTSAKFTGPTQSAFTSYQGHYAQSHPQKALAEQFPAAYSIQRMQQPGYHAGLQLPQGIEHAGQKQSGFEDKYKLGQSQIRGMVPSQQAGLMSQTLQLQQQQQQQQQQQSKNPNAFVSVSGYPARSQAPLGANYPTSTSGGTYTSQGSGSQGRPGYGPQSHGRYY